MTTKIQIILLFLAIMLAGCSENSKKTSPTRPMPFVEIDTGNTPYLEPTKATLIVKPLQTIIAEITPTPAISSTKTPSEKIKINQACIPVLTAPPKDYRPDGLIMLGGNKPILLDIKTGAEKVLPFTTSRVIISPDEKQYAIQNSNDVKVFSAAGNVLQAFTVRDGWFLDTWINEKQLSFIIEERTDPEQQWWNYPPNLYVINLSTMSVIELTSDLPNIYIGDPSLYWQHSGITVYDPSLTRVVYPGGGLVLWDVENNKEVAIFRTNNFLLPPVWSQDGSKFLINGDNGEFYSISREGIITQLSHFSSPFWTSGSYSWSPDGRNIAFWWILDDGFQTFALMDTKTGYAEDYCIKLGGHSLKIFPFYPDLPMWSTSGKQIVISANTSEDISHWDVIVVDIEKRMAIKVAEDRIPIGWLTQVDE